MPPIKKAPGFKEQLDPIGSPKIQKAPGFISALPGPEQQPTDSPRLSTNYIADSNLENYMATNQSKWEMFGKGLAQTASEAVLGTVEAASYLGDVEQMVSKLQGDEKEYTNWLAESMKELKGEVEEGTRVHQTLDAQEGFAPGDATWWAKNAPGTIGTALSLMVPGLGAAGVAGKGAKLLGAGKTGIKVASGIGATMVSRYAESTMEANQVFERTYNELKKNPNISDEDARAKAGDAASKTWNTNWVFSAMDFMQYTSLLKGFQSTAKGKVGKSVGEMIKTVASEAGEEAGQFVTAEEAYSSAAAETEFFGKGFQSRLGDYIKSPEFKASAFLGAIGGGVFTGVGLVFGAGKEDTENPLEQPKASPIKQERDEIAKRGVQKENANYVGDTGTSRKIDDLTFSKMAFEKLAKGQLTQYKAELEDLAKSSEAAPEAQKNIRDYVEDVQFLQDEQAKLKNSSIPSDLHTTVLTSKLEQRHLSRLGDNLTKELNDLKTEAVKNKDIPQELLAMKDLQMSFVGYSRLAKDNPEFQTKANQLGEGLKVQMGLTYPDQDPNALLHTSKDEDLFKKAFQIASTHEKIASLKQDLINITTSEGIAAVQQKIANKQIDETVDKTTNVDELLKLKQLTTDKNTQNKIDHKIFEAKQSKKEENKKSVVQAVDETAGPSVTESSPDIDTEFDTESLDNFDPDNFTDDFDPDFEPDQLDFAGLNRTEAAQVYGPEVAAQLFDRLESQPEEKPVATDRTESIQAQNQLTQKNTASVYLKERAGKWVNGVFVPEKDSTGAAVIQTWFDSEGKQVTPEDVFATDSDGNLLINTPNIQPGQIVTLRVENEFPYVVTPGFKPDKADNFVINAYLEGDSKPLFQLPSGDNPNLSNPTATRALRDLVIANKTVQTKIVDKNLGDLRQSAVLNSLEILGFDYTQDEKGAWSITKTTHNPIIGMYVGGQLKLPRIGQMKGMTNEMQSRLKLLDESIFSKQPPDGMSVTLRTNSKGELKVVPLDNRHLTETEQKWVVDNFAALVTTNKLGELNEVFNVAKKAKGVLKKDELGKLGRKRIYLIDLVEDGLELLVPFKGGWARIPNHQIDAFVKKQAVYGAHLVDKNGNPFKSKAGEELKGTFELNPADPKVASAYKAFDLVVAAGFRNVKQDNINSEIPYTDPVTKVEYPTFYDFATNTNTLTTNLMGSKTKGRGRESGYSVENATVYLDPNPNQTKIEVTPEEVKVTNVPPIPAPEDKKKTKGKRSLGDLYGKTRPYKEGNFQLIGEKELAWFEETIGPEYLQVAKGVDRILANGGVEAFGVYHNALVVLAEYAETGTAYHEAFHFVFENTLTPREQANVLKHDTEEELAEQFRDYMLSDGKNKPKAEPVKGFFSRLIQAIKNLLGLKSPIEKLFQNIATTPLSEKQKAAIGNSIKGPEKYRLLPGQITPQQQNDIIMATTHQIMDLARQYAIDNNIEFEDVFTTPKLIDKFFDVTKETFLKDFDRIDAIAEDDRSDEDFYRHKIYISMGIVAPGNVSVEDQPLIGQWEDKSTDLQVETGFKTEVLKNFAKFGFTVVLKDGTEYSVPDEGAPDDSEEIAELKQEDEGERIYDLDHTLIPPSKSLSQRIKAFLSTIPEPVINDRGEIVYNEDGTQKVKMTPLGTPKIIDFRKAFRNLTGKLADSGTPLEKLEKLSRLDPISKTIFDALGNEVAKGNQRLLQEFNTKLNLVRHPYVTFLYGRDREGSAFSKVIATDRADLQRTLINQWREGSIRRKLLEHDGTVVKNKAEHLYNSVKALATKDEANKKTTNYKELEAEFKGFLKEMGIELPNQTWTDLEGRRGSPKLIRDLMFGVKNSSLQAFLHTAAVDNIDPYQGISRQSFLNKLAAIAKSYVDDVRADVFLNEAGNQVNSINLPSWIAELLNDIRKDPQGKSNYYLQDKFYEGNQFIALWNSKEMDKVGFYLPSALRQDEGQPKEFGDRTSTDSYLMRLIGFHNGGANTSFISTGTLSDKSKQVFITLPKYSESTALPFVKTVLKNTVKQEITRIQQIKKGLPVDLKDYTSRGLKFLYIPELNNIPDLADSLYDGTLDPKKVADLNKQVDAVIDKFISNQRELFTADLVSKGILTRNENGELENVELPDALAALGVENIVNQFFYNDLAWRTEMSKVLHGDMALYKDADTYYKRGYQIVTPGLKAFNDPAKPTTLVRGIYRGTEKVNTDEYLLSLAQLIDPSIKSLKETSNPAVKTALKYHKINKTDAQSLMTVPAWKAITQQFGGWTKDHEEVYNFAWKDGLTITEAIRKHGYDPDKAKRMRALASKIVMQPFKPFQYSDRIIDTSSGKMLIKEQFKDSIAPLIPDFAKKHNNQQGGYGSLLTYMLDNGIDIMSAHDAVKVGTYGVIEDMSVPATENNKRTVSLSDIRFPQIVPDKVKSEITMLTQFWKLLGGNVDSKAKYNLEGKKDEVNGDELIEELNSLWAERTAAASKKLQTKLGLDSSWRFSEDKAKRKDQLFKLKTLLQGELASRDLNDNYEDSIQLILRNLDRPEFILHLGFPQLGRKFLSVLTNLFKKNILKQKEPGYSGVNLADYGVSHKEESSNLEFIKNENGGVTEAEIGMPIDFFTEIGLNWIEDVDPITNKIRWEKLNENQKKALQMIMVRIPTSNKSSMMPVRIAMVLPKAMGSAIMVPGEGTTQMGFDFDVDKSYLIKRVLDKEGKIDKESVDTKLFNVAWSILTSKNHIGELLTPLAAPTLEAKVKEYQDTIDPINGGTIVSTEEKASILSAVTDVRYEEQNKQGKRGIGIASRFNTGHAMMQHLADYIKVPGIDIKAGDYKFNKVGNKVDNEGNLISDNHAQMQHAELDAAKDPLLARLNVPPVLLPLAGYMTDLGVSLSLMIDFMNQPIIREWLKHYNITGATNPQNANSALLEAYPEIKAEIEEQKQAGAQRQVTLNTSNIKQGLDTNIGENVHVQAKVFSEFLKYFQHAQQMGRLNTVLSIDTFQDMTGIEAIESFDAIVKDITNPDSPVSISKEVFDFAKAPAKAKRLAAFYKYALEDAMSFTSQFYPYLSSAYKDIKNNFSKAVGIETLTDKEVLTKLNQFTDFYTMEAADLLRPVLDKVSPAWGSRWDYFNPEKSLWSNLQKKLVKFPNLKDNDFIKALESIQNNKKDSVQKMGVVNTNSNLDKSKATQGWWAMLTSENQEVRELAGDLIRYSIYTSGFGYNTSSFSDLIPIQFWVQNGIAENHRVILEGLQPNKDGHTAVQLNSNGAVRSFIRHNFAGLDVVPEVRYYEPKKGEPRTNLVDIKKKFTTGSSLMSFTVNDSDPLFNRRNRTFPQFVKLWDYTDKKYRLYEASPTKPNKTQTLFKEVQALGEEGAFFEVTPSGTNQTVHPKNKDVTSGAPFGIKQLNSLDDTIKAQSLRMDAVYDTARHPLLSKYIPEGSTEAVVTLQRLVENETNPDSKKMLQVMLNNVKKITSIVKGEAAIGIAGFYRPAKNGERSIIGVNPFASIKSDSDARHLLTHELAHAYMAGVIANPVTEEEKSFKRNMERLWEKAKQLDPSNENIYNLQEFVAELASNKNFREKLHNSSLWSTLLRLIRKLFGFKDNFDKGLDMMYQAINEMEDLQRPISGDLNLKMGEEKKSPGQRKKLDILEKVLSTLDSREKRLRAFGQKERADELREDIKTLNELSGVKRNQFVVKFLATVFREVEQLKGLVTKLNAQDPASVNPNLILSAKEQLDSYSVLNQIRLELRKNPEAFVPIKEAVPGLLKQFEALFADIQALKEDTRSIMLNRVANVIKNKSNNPDLKVEEIRDRLEVADRDISITNRLFDPMADSSDEALASLDKLIKHAYSEGNREANRDLYTKETKEETVEYKHFNENSKRWNVADFKYKKVGLFTALSEFEAWAGNKDSIADKFSAILDKDTLTQNVNGVMFISPISEKGKKIMSIKEGDKDYPLKQFYTTFVLGYLKSQESIHLPSMRPGLRIPSIQRSLLEGLLRDKDKLSIFKQEAIDAVRRRYDEVDFKAVDENGKPQDYLPIRFISRQDGKDGRLNTREVSLDVATTIGIFMNEMHTYSQLEKIVADAELIKTALQERDVVKQGGRVEGHGLSGFLTRERKTISDPESGLIQTIKGNESNAYKAAETGIRRLIYGQMKKDAGQAKVFGQNIDIRKTVDTFLKFTGLRILFGNIAIPLTNLGMGHLTMMKEMIGGNLVNKDNWLAGQKFYTTVLKDAILDLGNREKKTKFGRVFTYFNPADNKRPVDHIGIDTNTMRTVLPHLTRGMSEAAEFNLSSIALGAVFDRFKATDANGKEVSMYDAIEVSMDGAVSLIKGYKYKGKSTLQGKDIDEVRDYALRLYQNMNGVYNQLDSAAIKETVAGSLLMFMRNWLAPGIATRYRLKHYDERLQQENEGHYVSAMILFNNFFHPERGFMQGAVDSLKTLLWMEATDPELLLLPNELGLPEEKKKQLIEMRKANTRKTLFELYVIAGMTLIMFAGFDDDDQDSYALYMLARMRREMMTFFDPSTAWDVLRSPTVALNTVEAITKATWAGLNATGALLTDQEVKVMQQDKGKGMQEWWYRTRALTPLSQMDQFEALDVSVRLITKGWK